ncbi:MAG: hypothetical protein SNJ71_01625 [Bacteroidales bacterium]
MNKKKYLIGLIVGIIAGLIDVIPMILQKLTWDANLSAFSMWVIVGLFISSVDWKINSILKGIMVSFFTLIPCAIIIGMKEPFSLIPILVMTLILGAISGFFINKFSYYERY